VALLPRRAHSRRGPSDRDHRCGLLPAVRVRRRRPRGLRQARGGRRARVFDAHQPFGFRSATSRARPPSNCTGSFLPAPAIATAPASRRRPPAARRRPRAARSARSAPAGTRGPPRGARRAGRSGGRAEPEPIALEPEHDPDFGRRDEHVCRVHNSPSSQRSAGWDSGWRMTVGGASLGYFGRSAAPPLVAWATSTGVADRDEYSGDAPSIRHPPPWDHCRRSRSPDPLLPFAASRPRSRRPDASAFCERGFSPFASHHRVYASYGSFAVIATVAPATSRRTRPSPRGTRRSPTAPRSGPPGGRGSPQRPVRPEGSVDPERRDRGGPERSFGGRRRRGPGRRHRALERRKSVSSLRTRVVGDTRFELVTSTV
jgi:hypothetical protein